MNKSLVPKINLGTFLVLMTCAFAYIIYKAIHVPITHDEISTLFFYSKFSSWEIMMYPDSIPNNHILNTLLTKYMISLFGMDEIVVRLPNVISFILYGFGAYRILCSTVSKSSAFFIPGAILFIMNPYLLDFFGVSRGYGMSTALMLLSLSYLISSFRVSNTRHLWLALILGCLASYANFTLLIYWATICVLILCFYLINRKGSKRFTTASFTSMILVGIAYLALIITPILKMSNNDEFRFWTSNGFVDETIKSLAYNALYSSRIFLTINLITYFVITIYILHLLLLVIRFIKSSDKLTEIRKSEYIVTIVLTLVVLINSIQCWLLKTPNLNGRTALFYYPLFITTLLTMHVHFNWIRQYWIKISIGVILSFFGIHHLFHTATPKQVREWSYDAHTIDALKIIEKHRSTNPISISTHWLYNPSFHYYTYDQEHLNLFPYSKELNPKLEADYFYINDSLLYMFDSTFISLKRYDDGNTILFNTKIQD